MDEVKRELESLYAQIEEAFKKKDLKTVDQFLTSDYSVTKPDGQTLNRAELMAGFQSQFDTMDLESWERHITAIERVGNDVATTAHGEYIAVNRDTKEPICFDTDAVDTWTKTDQGWKVRHSR